MNPTFDQFIETIRWSHGRYHLTALHARRMLHTSGLMHDLAQGGLDRLLPPVPDAMRDETVKCRIIYDTEIRSIELEPYKPKSITTLQMVEDDTIDYRLKYADRSRLAFLMSKRGEADEIIIVKNGLITDSSYSNLVFQAGSRLLTPAHPLLRGVMMTHLLSSGDISPANLAPEDILPGNRYGITHVKIINAMLPLGAMPPVDIARIYPPVRQ